jgi:hypothetical protein
MGVKKSAYRQPVTPEGLKAIEKGTLTWLDDEMYNNLNTGVLEQYLEEKNLEEAFEVSHWDTRKVLLGIAIHWTQTRFGNFSRLVYRLCIGYGTQMVTF